MKTMQPRGMNPVHLLSYAVTLMGVLALGLCIPVAAQTASPTPWATSGSNIYNTNGGNVGVGTQTPAGRLEVQGPDGILVLSQAGVTMKTSVQAAIGKDLHLSGNAVYSGGAWNRFDTASPVWNFVLSPHADYATIRRASPGPNPIPWSGADGWAELLVVRNNGNVGIGTSTPGHRLHVAGPVNATGFCLGGVCKSSWSEISGAASQWTTAGSNISYSAGSVGIGTSTPGARFDVGGGAAARGGYTDVLVGAGGNNPQIELYGATRSSAIAHDESQGGMVIYMNGPTWSPALIISHAGNVSAAGNINAAGNITADGSIAAKYQDVAEWVPARGMLAAGTVVVLDPEASNHVMASAVAYDTRVAGVVSETPGIILGEAGEGKVKVATTGRVRVKVDATRGPIRIGDLLVTSDEAGVAMRSEAVSIGGRKMHAPGTIIGKALEPLGKGVGEILVLLSLQ